MKTCPYCAHSNREGVLFCEECGQVLYTEQGAQTSTKRLPTGTGGLNAKSGWGTARFSPKSTIVLQIRDNPSPIEIEPQQETIIGRYDGSNSTTPTIDLTPYGAYEHGVSRIHAAIRRGEDTLMLVDLGSVNGTHLNGQRLIPNQPRVLRDGDEIRIGKLVCHIYFKTDGK
ncbi:MAG: hypothetical protein CUN49_03690 [Candidatus Thermofonsia Clade 1 bacterium]|jgi:hypothetical protein|uniref:FHA domain-containing protein n=1 Tax=Candidatus Thermofonsia Clade 1 bacterium TaxID=2364210 RepID=A0A2M8PGX0_9CHLR|nr:MAG: hypothetical protein CUN49_03690 [Candidatus Thermofonsia Clade 1 bacterium]RMF51886.1 MAG: FHA domain-containing protein [Chloroflexota bacterium]